MKGTSRIRVNPLTPAEWRQQRPSIPRRYRAITRGAVLGPSKSQARAIHAFCLECQGYNGAAVYACETHCCPLWRFRPIVTQGAGDGREEFAPETPPETDYAGSAEAV